MTTRDQCATWMPSPNKWDGRIGRKPAYIIIHGTAGGNNGSSATYLCQPSTQASAHYVITQSGRIYQLVDEEASAWGNGIISGPAGTGGDGVHHDSWWTLDTNPNLVTISIEHEKPDDQNATPLTQAQMLASFALVARICQRWNIPMRKADASGGITGHFSIDPVSRSHCPGDYPWNGLFSYLATQENEGVEMLQLTDPMGKFFTDKGGNRWHCNNTNVDIAYAHLDFYRKYQGIFGLPVSGELAVDQFPGVSAQIYERAIACYDPRHQQEPANPATTPAPVYLLRIDRGIGQQVIAKSLVTELQNQITQLKAQLAAVNTTELDAIKKQLSNYQQALQKINAIAESFEVK